MILNKIVSFSLAKLLKEKNYEDEDCENIYLGDFDEEFPPEKIEVSTRNLRQRNLGEFDCLAPTIADVIDWIYTKYGIWTSVNKVSHNGNLLGFRFIIEDKDGFIDYGVFASHTEAYEYAIKYVLENLI